MPGTLPPTRVTRHIEAVDCLDFSGKTKYNDFRDDLVRDGYAVIPAIAADKAKEYADAFHTYLEELFVVSPAELSTGFREG